MNHVYARAYIHIHIYIVLEKVLCCKEHKNVQDFCYEIPLKKKKKNNQRNFSTKAIILQEYMLL